MRRRRLAGAAVASTLALPGVAAADGSIAEWCEVDPDVLRLDGHTYHVRYEVRHGDQHRVHELVAFITAVGLITVSAPADLEYRATVVRVN